MCGRYARKTSVPEIARILGATPMAEFAPSYNVAPSRHVPVCRDSAGGGREITLLRWGLVPHWAKTADDRYRMINARAETVANKPAFRTPFRKRRCLVPADGYYEWKAGDRRKQPYFIHRRDQAPIKRRDVQIVLCFVGRPRSPNGQWPSSITKPTCPRHGARHFLALTRDPLLTVLADHRHDRISRRHLLVGIGRDRVKWIEGVDTPVPWESRSLRPWESRSFRGRRYHDGCQTGPAIVSGSGQFGHRGEWRRTGAMTAATGGQFGYESPSSRFAVCATRTCSKRSRRRN